MDVFTLSTVHDCYECFKNNSDPNLLINDRNYNYGVYRHVCFGKFVKVLAERIIHNVVASNQYWQRGAFLDKVVPLFRLNKFIYYINIHCCFISVT